MASEKQLRANRENAMRSTGPKTAAGRLKSSRNALRHGLSLPLMADPAAAMRHIRSRSNWRPKGPMSGGGWRRSKWRKPMPSSCGSLPSAAS